MIEVELKSVEPDPSGEGTYRVTSAYQLPESGSFDQFSLSDGKRWYMPGGLYFDAIRDTVVRALDRPNLDIVSVDNSLFMAPQHPGDKAEVALTVHDSNGHEPLKVTAVISNIDGVECMRTQVGVAAEPADPPPSWALIPTGSPRPVAIDQTTLRSWVPYRAPLLMLDRVIGIYDDGAVETVKAVSVNEIMFAALPDDTADSAYRLPAWALMSSLGHAATAAAKVAGPEAVKTDIAIAVTAEGYHLHAHVRPGDLLRHYTRIIDATDRRSTVSVVTANADGDIVATVDRFVVQTISRRRDGQ